jgi:hypothetical protein
VTGIAMVNDRKLGASGGNVVRTDRIGPSPGESRP